MPSSLTAAINLGSLPVDEARYTVMFMLGPPFQIIYKSNNFLLTLRHYDIKYFSCHYKNPEGETPSLVLIQTINLMTYKEELLNVY